MALSVVRSDLSPAEFLARLRAGDPRPLDDLYRLHRPAFGKWAGARHPGLRDADLADAFQEAVVTLYENIASGRLTELTASPRTYVFGLAERFCLKAEKTSAKTVNNLTPSGIKGSDDSEFDDSMFTLSDFSALVEPLAQDPYALDEREEVEADHLARIGRALHQLFPGCRRLLTAVYYEGLPTEALLEAFNYQTLNVLASRKSQCLDRLRALCGVSS